jgi:hypothetical protein
MCGQGLYVLVSRYEQKWASKMVLYVTLWKSSEGRKALPSAE